MNSLSSIQCRVVVLLLCSLLSCTSKSPEQNGLVGYWKLKGDCKDYSGKDNHATNHFVNLESGEFNGKDSYLEVPDSPSLNFGTGEFSLSAWIYTENDQDDVIGDVLSKYDSSKRKGFNLTINSSASGYNSHGNDKHVYFGVDNDKLSRWEDCGRPSEHSHTSDSLTVFNGKLYAGMSDAKEEKDWAHVYRYEGDQAWRDCGRLGNFRTRGVRAMIVHNGDLYAATTASHGRQAEGMDYGRVYRYRGGEEWEGCGQPGEHLRLNSIASYKGHLYVTGYTVGGGLPFHCYVYKGGTSWGIVKEFWARPNTMAVHDGKLYVAINGRKVKGAEVHAFDGNKWESLGNPFGSPEMSRQIHSMRVYRGFLYVGTWPQGRIAAYKSGKWEDRGRLGDATEITALVVHNGTLLAGTIPRAEIFRYEGQQQWTSMKRLFAPEGWDPQPVGSADTKGFADWTRASSMSIYEGRLFATTATCERTNINPPLSDETRGRVYCVEVGKCVSYDEDLGSGWRHLVATRDANSLKLYIDGELKVFSTVTSNEYDISNNKSLRIGYGETDYFSGKIREVRVYNRVVNDKEVRQLYEEAAYL